MDEATRRNPNEWPDGLADEMRAHARTLDAATRRAGKPWGFWATMGLTAVAMIAFAAASFAAVIALEVFARRLGVMGAVADGRPTGLAVSVAEVVAAPVTVALVVVFAWLRRGIAVRDYLGLRWPRSRQALLWILATVAVLVGEMILAQFVQAPQSDRWMEGIYRTRGSLVLLGLAIVVFAPIMEEMVFRGFMTPGIRHSPLGVAGALIIPSLCWVALHTQYMQNALAVLPVLFTFGIVLGAARLTTGSVYLCIGMHMLNNAVAFAQVAALM